jgi:hypothetical protein
VERSVVEEFNGYHAEGARAYVLRQAALFGDVADRFEGLWAGLAGVEMVETLLQPAPEPIDGGCRE